jgi:hypothetical protein
MFLSILPEYKCAKRLPMTQQEKVINTVRWFKILWANLTSTRMLYRLDVNFKINDK